MSNTLVVYDADPDGYGCAYAAWYAFGDDADYMEVLHGSELPDDAFGYDNVYILDLSFSAEDYDSLLAAGIGVTVIDHHPSAMKNIELFDLNPLPYDTTRAACVQSWEYFNPWIPVPMLLQYVGDRDTWTFALPASEEINQYIFTLDKDPWAWKEGNRVIEHQFEDALKIGAHLIVYRDKLVDEMVEEVTIVPHWQGAPGDIPFLNAPVLHSEVGHRLLDLYPSAPFSVTYLDMPDSGPKGLRKYSLRSEDGRTDVGEFAKVRGGGGHHNAAGFSRPLSIIWEEGYEAIQGS